MALAPTPPNPKVLPEITGTQADALLNSGVTLVAYTASGPFKLELLRTGSTTAVQGYLTALGIGGSGGAGTVTITGITFTPLGSVVSGMAADTVIGMLSASVSGGTLTNPVYSVTTNTWFKVVGAQVLTKIALTDAHIGDRPVLFHLAADNAATFDKPSMNITIGPAVVIPTGAGGYPGLDLDKGANYRYSYGAADTLAIPFEFKAENAVAIGDSLKVDFEFGLGDMPPGGRLYGKNSDNSTFPIYMSLVNSTTVAGVAYPKYVRLDWLSPVARAVGAIHAFTIHWENVAQDNTPHKSVAQIISGSDILLESAGVDEVSPMRVRINDVLATTQRTAGGSFGADPAQAWYVTHANPACVGISGFAYFRRISDNGLDAFRCVQFFIDALPNNEYRVELAVQQPNMYGPLAGATVGVRSDQIGVISDMTVKNGSTVIRKFGGTDGPDAFDVGASAFDTGSGYMALPAGTFYSDRAGDGIPVTFTGSGTPSGLASGVFYVIGGASLPTSTRYVRFATERQNDLTSVAFGNAGTGTCRVIPHVGTFGNCSPPLLDWEARPLWISSTRAEQPKILPKHDLFYASRRAAMLQDYDLSDPAFTGGSVLMPNQTKPKYFPNLTWEFARNETLAGNNVFISGTGGILTEDRLGPQPWTHTHAQQNPYDAATQQRIRYQAAVYMSHNKTMRDEASGRIPVLANGPNNDGTQFPGLGANDRSLRFVVNGQSWGTRGWKTGTDWQNSVRYGSRGHGCTSGYGTFTDDLHCPQFLKTPAYMTGSLMFRMAMLDVAVTVAGSTDKYDMPVAGDQTYYMCNTSLGRATRGLWRFVDADAAVPDIYAEAAYLHQVMSNTGKFYQVASQTGELRHLGLLNGFDRPYFFAENHSIIAEIVRKGKYPIFAEGVEHLRTSLFDYWDDERPPGAMTNAGAGASTYEWPSPRVGGESNNNAGAAPHPDIRTMLLAFYSDNAPARSTGLWKEKAAYSPGGLESRGNGQATPVHWAQTKYVTLGNLGLVYLPPRDARIASQLYERMTTSPSSFPRLIGHESYRAVTVDVPPANKQVRTQRIDAPATSGTITGPAVAAVENVPATFTVAFSGGAYAWVGLSVASTGVAYGARTQRRVTGTMTLTPGAGTYKAGLFADPTGGSPIHETAAFTASAAPPDYPAGMTTVQSKVEQSRTSNQVITLPAARTTGTGVILLTGGYSNAAGPIAQTGWTDQQYERQQEGWILDAKTAPSSALVSDGVTMGAADLNVLAVLIETHGTVFSSSQIPAVGNNGNNNFSFTIIPKVAADEARYVIVRYYAVDQSAPPTMANATRLAFIPYAAGSTEGWRYAVFQMSNNAAGTMTVQVPLVGEFGLIQVSARAP